MSQLADLFKALSDGGRLRIVRLLAAHEQLCACKLSQDLKLSAATLSRHMAQLQQVGLVQSRKQGRWVHYSLQGKDQLAAALLEFLQTHAAECRLQQDMEDSTSCNDAK